ncbi:RsmE family RNA methyltransferase [Paenibacillus sp. GCM10012307]|uniref:Ribosomal RNA small subunit methyltransferase E n=1 Tax=Paenibacillus roseus TaxID=2798579 RepID=A0A934J7C3_9BACL|nr:RsmE family RNA methyltransferase [Paenibacillus roseus]MBJ6363094.1 16S rRNA (uracil(1498)-N(3))-methyltransferase [Paenibacillus roseus]
MQRYFIAPEQFGQHTVTITGDDAHHLLKVMRMKAGDEIVVCDGLGRSVHACLTTLVAGTAEADIIAEIGRGGEPLWKVTVAQSLPKGDKLETVIQKCTEIGAAAFVPFQSLRSIVQYDGKKEEKRQQRWAKIAKEAAEQSHRSIIPDVSQVMSWKQLLLRMADYDLVLFCYEKEGAASGGGIADVLASFRHTHDSGREAAILLVVGPEGGFTAQEADEALASGAKLAGLGPRILRTETAAMVGLTCLMYESKEMGGA